MAEEKGFKLRVITPERVFYENTVEMVEFNTVEGEIGVYPGHVPMTVIVKPGILTITENDRARNAALHAGFVEILQDQITILAEVIEWPDEIDRQRAEAAKLRAEDRLKAKTKDTDVFRAEAALQKALTRLQTTSK